MNDDGMFNSFLCINLNMVFYNVGLFRMQTSGNGKTSSGEHLFVIVM